MDCKATSLVQFEVFLTYNGVRSRKAEKFFEVLRKDNEVKLEDEIKKSVTSNER